MISHTSATNIVLNCPRLISKPLWHQLALQLTLVTTVGLLSAWFLVGDVRRTAIDDEARTVQTRLDIQSIQQKLDAMPLLSMLLTQLAEKTAHVAPFQPDRLAQLIVAPLSQANASLLSWKPVLPHAGEPPQEQWRLAFSADYASVLLVLRELTELPYVLRIAQLTVKSDSVQTALPLETRRLQVALSLIRPGAGHEPHYAQ
ncbi:hypothetical protein [Pectobacterium cacticida]|uniref:hypothetical protein n=1 Tax=Pectobacterium cacticida TaxID=69221 RepID=UPI0039867525